MKKIDIDRRILENYVKQGIPQHEIAINLGISQGTVSLKIRQYGIKTRDSCKKSKYNPERMKKYMQQGLTITEIADKMDVSQPTVRNWIRVHDLKKFKQAKQSSKKLCPTCIYRDVRKYAGGCNYLDRNNHSRGCPVIGCTVYVEGTPPDGRKKRRKK